MQIIEIGEDKFEVIQQFSKMPKDEDFWKDKLRCDTIIRPTNKSFVWFCRLIPIVTFEMIDDTVNDTASDTVILLPEKLPKRRKKELKNEKQN